ncbi:hypothetical protein AVEN_224192-1 [Araneus ventricosus]|uniref:Uncharacterized protein n=1 Tax=Araneus ventricosus TaxID=182803 RepID=A0A4Y2EJT7_ARAVE|nr:hypothetical protein AVEN_224192-1 [Araneus ventricosus]
MSDGQEVVDRRFRLTKEAGSGGNGFESQGMSGVSKEYTHFRAGKAVDFHTCIPCGTYKSYTTGVGHFWNNRADRMSRAFLFVGHRQNSAIKHSYPLLFCPVNVAYRKQPSRTRLRYDKPPLHCLEYPWQNCKNKGNKNE